MEFADRCLTGRTRLKRETAIRWNRPRSYLPCHHVMIAEQSVGVTPLQLQKAVVLLQYRRVVHRRWRASACGQPAFMPPTVHGRADSPAHGPVAPRRCGRSCSPRPRLPRFCCAGRTAAPVSFAHTRLAFGYPDHRLSAVDQQRAQIRVAVFLMPRSHCLPWRAAWGPIPARPPAAVHSTASINR